MIHVAAGMLALVAGFIALGTVKGSKKHVSAGRYFLWMIAIVIFTALIGIFAFNRNTFLLVITLLSGYNACSGFRAIRLHGSKPALPDYIIPLIALSSGGYYLYYINSIGQYWAPVIVFSTLGALALICIYDLSRVFMPVELLKKTFIYEHIYKLTSALSGITSAFTGTVFPQFEPYSQILPSILGLTYIIFACYRVKNNALR